MLDGIPGTSLWGLKARAEESLKPEGLFVDPLASEWLERLEPFTSDSITQWYNPLLQKAIALRTDIFDRTVERFLTLHEVPVVVELGAGFSTRFSRLKPTVQWYELDIPEIMELRLSLKEADDPLHWFLADSIFAEEWTDNLSAYPPEKVLFLAEGLLMYFPRPRVEQFFIMLKRCFGGATIAFDIMGSWNLKAAQQPGEDVNAPVYWGLNNLVSVPELFQLEFLADLSLASQLRQNTRYRKHLNWRQRILLSQHWLTQNLGGTVLARL